MGKKLTIDDGRKALTEHAREKGAELREAYGPDIDYPTLLRILEDRDHVRFPVKLGFDDRRIEPGCFALVEPSGELPENGYVILLHAHFEKHPEDIVPLALYQLVSINYGDFATYRDAEAFGSAALGMEQDAYYERICELTDRIP